jgi:hypothetical protein
VRILREGDKKKEKTTVFNIAMDERHQSTVKGNITGQLTKYDTIVNKYMASSASILASRQQLRTEMCWELKPASYH